jgi:hypothetical protein
VLLGLERERVRVHTWVWAARVVVEGLHLVEVLTLLGFKSVLTVQDQFEVGQWTNLLFGELLGRPAVNTGTHDWHTSTLGDWHDRQFAERPLNASASRTISTCRWRGGEVPQRGRRVRGRWIVEAPDQFLNWVVVAETLVGSGARSDGIGTSVLDLLDEVFVTLLRKSASLFGVEIHVVRPDLENILVKVGLHVGRQIEIDADFVVLEGNEWQIQTWVAVEEEDQWQVHSLTVNGGGHLTPVSLLGLVQVKLGVQTPPALVVLVDALTTDGQFSGRDRTLGDPARVGHRRKCWKKSHRTQARGTCHRPNHRCEQWSRTHGLSWRRYR